MKNLVILGAARSGKSFLSKNVIKELAKHNKIVSLIPQDALLETVVLQRRTWLWKNGLKRIVKNIPALSRLDEKRNHQNLIQSTRFFINHIEKDIITVVEGTHITPQEALNVFDSQHFKIVIVGYPKISVKQKVAEIREFDKNSYISHKSDQELTKAVSNLIEQSKKDYEFAKKHKIKFLDTSKDYQGTIKDFAKNIIEFLK